MTPPGVFIVAMRILSMAGFRLDYSKLCGLDFRIRDERLVAMLREMKCGLSCARFVEAHSLHISANAFSSWIRCEYGIPIDVAARLVGRKRLNKLEITKLYSGKAAGHCCATLPAAPTMPLMYLVGATLGDGSLRHAPGNSYFVSYEMADRGVMDLIRRSFRHVFLVPRSIERINRSDGRRSYFLKYSNKVVYYFLIVFSGSGQGKRSLPGCPGLMN